MLTLIDEHDFKDAELADGAILASDEISGEVVSQEAPPVEAKPRGLSGRKLIGEATREGVEATA